MVIDDSFFETDLFRAFPGLPPPPGGWGRFGASSAANKNPLATDD